MKLLLTLSMLIIVVCSTAQIKTSSLRAVPIIENRTYELDGGTFVVFGQSRVTIPIELPENTVEWYYVFSSFSNEDVVNSNRVTIDLLSQLTLILDETGTTANALSTLLAPSGSSNCNVYLFPNYENSKNFLNKVDQDIFTSATWQYQVHGSIEAARQGKQQVKNVSNDTYYLGIQAGNSPVVVKIEVVAIVDDGQLDLTVWSDEMKGVLTTVVRNDLVSRDISEITALEIAECTINKLTVDYTPAVFFDFTESTMNKLIDQYNNKCAETINGNEKTEEEKKADSFGNLGWQHYENGNIDKAIEYSSKALAINKDMGWVETNMGLFYLIKGDEAKAIEYYIDAIYDLKNDKLSGKHYFQAAIDDIQNATKKYPGLSGYKEILEELKREFNAL